MLPDDAPALTYCRDVLLPIWETWADGDPAMRRALECRADPASHTEQRERLQARLWRLLGTDDEGAGTTAAVQAGWATLLALGAQPGELGEGWRDLCRTAEATHQQALAEVGGGD